jgi:endonuclease III
MIDPLNVTDYRRNQAELEEFWLFCVMVAGKNADQTAQKVHRLLAGRSIRQTPLGYLRSLGPSLPEALRGCRCGQYRRIGRALAESFSLDLRSAAVEQLQRVHGVGPKTARYFVLHTRCDAHVAVLDTHLLKWMRRLGVENVPQHTPGSLPQYLRLESLAIGLMRQTFPGMTLAEADLHVWATVSGRRLS